jgi:response regulator of citrate/malate metabolism
MERMIDYCIPEDMEQYLAYYGHHFNKKLCDFAVSKMKKEDKATGMPKAITPMKMEELKSLLEKNKVELESEDWYDALYLANMVKADLWGSSIEDEEHLAKYVEDVICDIDGYDGIVFCRYLADCSAKGIVIHWDMMI